MYRILHLTMLVILVCPCLQPPLGLLSLALADKLDFAPIALWTITIMRHVSEEDVSCHIKGIVLTILITTIISCLLSVGYHCCCFQNSEFQFVKHKLWRQIRDSFCFHCLLVSGKKQVRITIASHFVTLIHDCCIIAWNSFSDGLVVVLGESLCRASFLYLFVVHSLFLQGDSRWRSGRALS